MSNPLDMTPEDVSRWTKELNEVFHNRYMTSKEVETTYGISMARQSQLIRANKVIAVRDGQRVYYDREYAVWWFSAYKAQLDEKAAKPKSKRKPGPRKIYTYTLNGVEYTDERPFGEVAQEWRVKIARVYPQYFEDVETAKLKQDVTLATNQQYYFDVVKHFNELSMQERKFRTEALK